MPTPRDLLLTALHRQIAWFRQARRPTAATTDLTDGRCRDRYRRPALHPLARLVLSNRDHEEITLRPMMWTLFEV